MTNWNATYNESNCNRLDIRKSIPPAEGEYLANAYNFSDDCLFTDGKKVYIGYCGFDTDDDGIIESFAWYAGGDLKIENVTHWANLPDLPQN